MKIILIALSSFLAFGLSAQQDSLFEFFEADNETHRIELNEHYDDKESSPLEKKDRKKFKELPFFPLNMRYRIEAQWIRTPDEEAFEMATSTDRKPLYIKYAEVHFTLDSIPCKLNVYQNINLVKKEGYEDYLFLPFKDFTNGERSYGGGRYLDLHIPEGDTIVLDFNKAYNPYCAYNHKYSCPIVPEENQLDIPIEAGIHDGIIKK